MSKKNKASRPQRKRKTGLPPGSMVFTGRQFLEESHVTLLQYNQERLEEQQTRDSLPVATSGKLTNWYDLRGLHQVELVRKLGEQFQLHPLVMEDIVDTDQRPKFEEFEAGIFCSLQAFRFDPEKAELSSEQVSIYSGPGFALSFQEKEDDLFIQVRQRLHSSSGRIRQRQSDYLLYAMVDTVVDHYYLILDQLQETIDQLEEDILDRPQSDTRSRLHHLKTQILLLRKSVAPLREAVNRFSRSEHPLVEESTKLFSRDLFDHTIFILDMIDTYRDMLNGLYDLYLSEISYRMNLVMQTLTIIATIFIPLTFLAGIYGMNFKYMPELEWRYSYFVLWGIMLMITLLLLWFFRRRRWL